MAKREERPGGGYAKVSYIVLIAAYLFIITVGIIWRLAYVWPSCETTNLSPSAAGDMQVSAVLPGFGKADDLVSIRGTGFADGATVSFGGGAGIKSTFVNSTHILVRPPPPANVGKVVEIVVTNPDGKIRALNPAFFYLGPTAAPTKPSVNSISPASGSLAGGQLVTIKGSGLKNTTTVSFGGFPGTDVRVQDDATVRVTPPPHGDGKVDVSVEAGDTATLPDGYLYTCWATVPSHLFWMVVLAGALGGSLHGLRSLVWHVGMRDLRTSWLLKYFLFPVQGAAIAVVFFLAASAGLYTLQGTGNLILIGLAGLVGMFSDQAAEKLKKIAEGLLSEVQKPSETDVAAPALAVDSLEPKSGSVEGKTAVNIIGDGFGEGVVVCFGEHEATVQAGSKPTLIIAATPPHAAGKVDVAVINKTGQSFTVRGGYEYVEHLTAPPTIHKD